MNTPKSIIINKTPHPLNLVNLQGDVVIIAPTLPAARVEAPRTGIDPVAGFPVSYVTLGKVVDLPEPQPDTIYVVSSMVLDRVPDRVDVFAPGELIRDDDGRVIGANGLTATAPNAKTLRNALEAK
jgi:hypothetical protein